MKFEKQALFAFNMPYALGWMVRDGVTCAVAATEDHGSVVIVPPPFDRAEVLVPGPGGCMSLISDPEKPGELYAIMGCFLGYQFHGGAVYRIADGGRGFEAKKLVDLPFAHRMEIVRRAGQKALILTNLAETKVSPADWSRPGTVFSINLEQSPWGEKVPLLENIHKNHGILQGPYRGRPSLLISGQEGVFVLDLERPDAAFTPVLNHEVSEIALFDLDGDGENELVTIEPFHGNVLAVYRWVQGAWTRAWETSLDYGHCVLAETVAGRPSILVSNRAGSKDLLLFQFSPRTPSAWAAPTRTVVEAGVGAANMLIARHGGQEFILATNQAQGELVRYRLLPDAKA